MKKNLFRFLNIIFIFGLISYGVLADGGGGWRQPTRQEKEFHHMVLTSIHNALPSGPADWQQVIAPDRRELTRVYVGTEKVPFRIDYVAEWQDVNKKAIGDQKVLEAQVAFRQSHQNDPEVNALNEERRRLSTAIGQATAKNDPAAVKRYMKELDAADTKLKTIYNRWDKELDEIAAANEAHDFNLKIHVSVNVFYSGLDKMATGTLVAGIPVYRIPGGHIGGVWVGEQNRVFLGKNLKIFESNGQTVVKAPPSPGLPHTSVRLIDIFIQADPERTRHILEGINWVELKRLIQ